MNNNDESDASRAGAHAQIWLRCWQAALWVGTLKPLTQQFAVALEHIADVRNHV